MPSRRDPRARSATLPMVATHGSKLMKRRRVGALFEANTSDPDPALTPGADIETMSA